MAIVRKGFAQPQRIQATQDQLTSFNNQVASYTKANAQYAKTHGGTFATPGQPINLGVVRNQPARVVNADGAATAGLGLLGAAAVAAPAIAPVAAAAGVGYGIYKLGESFNLW